jgi:hypothetical protein
MCQAIQRTGSCHCSTSSGPASLHHCLGLHLPHQHSVPPKPATRRTAFCRTGQCGSTPNGMPKVLRRGKFPPFRRAGSRWEELRRTTHDQHEYNERTTTNTEHRPKTRKNRTTYHRTIAGGGGGAAGSETTPNRIRRQQVRTRNGQHQNIFRKSNDQPQPDRTYPEWSHIHRDRD